MTDGEMEVIVVLTVEAGVATVRLPDTSLEEWSVASLPEGTRPGDRIGVTLEGGDVDLMLLPRTAGLQA